MEEGRFAFKVFYLGSNYYGFQRQPDVPTVENEIFRVFNELDLLAEDSKYTAASRTDRGVHALGQVIAVNLKREPDLDEINELLPNDIAFWALSRVSSNFNARRKALYRHYKYVCRNPGVNIDLVREALKCIIGVHNFKNLCYKAYRSTIRRIYLADIKVYSELSDEEFLIFSFYGASFARGLIRKTVSAVIMVGLGEMSLDEFKMLLNPRYTSPKGIRLYPSDGLFLVDAYYPIAFKIHLNGVEKVREILEGMSLSNGFSGVLGKILLNEFEKLISDLSELSSRIDSWNIISSSLG